MPAPPDTALQQEIVGFKCPQCGATTAFSAADKGLTCTHCGYYEAPQKAVVGKTAKQLEFTTDALKREALPEFNTSDDSSFVKTTRKELSCQSCGALTSIPLDSLAHTCPFCGSNNVIQRQEPHDLLQPRFLIPFKILSSDCLEISRNWLGSSWITPTNLHNLANVNSFSGIYLPFWTFHAITRAQWKAEVGHIKRERYFDNGEWRERTVVEWHWESGNVRLNIEDLLVPGTSRLSKLILSGIKNFDLNELAPYEPSYLAGLQAQAYDIPLEQAWDTGRAEMREKTRQTCLSQASNTQVRNFSMNLDFADESWRYVLLPVYLTNFMYDKQSYQVMINGQNGEIAGQRPADWNKVWLVIAVLLAPGLLLGLLGLITIPVGGLGVGIGIFGFILLIIGLVISFILYNKAQSIDDI